MVFNNNADSDKRGQVGIGTLIVFIAMVLVAAIAAGVLVNTAGFLQETAEQTGQESQAQVSDRVTAVSAYMTMDSSDPPVATNFDVILMRSAGSDNINLASITYVYYDSTGAVERGVIDPNDATQVTDISGGADGFLDADTDRVRYTFTPAASVNRGEEFTLELITESGAKTVIRGTVPSNAVASEIVEF
jgi:flagellin-like protein